ncbi:MAG TPA: preprotein translocase subunit SecG [Pyrinomonadaceae bacterium]|nr:preprotein translocase subunit SecG [Pyrinomonadaceae bacterium]
MTYFLYALFILACVVMVVAVLLQPGKADAGALFTSSVSSTAFGPRGTQTLLAKITIAAAALFMLGALALSLPFATGSRSVVESEAETPAPVQPATPPAAPAQNTSSAPAGNIQTGDNSGGAANTNA